MSDQYKIEWSVLRISPIGPKLMIFWNSHLKRFECRQMMSYARSIKRRTYQGLPSRRQSKYWASRALQPEPCTTQRTAGRPQRRPLARSPGPRDPRRPPPPPAPRPPPRPPAPRRAPPADRPLESGLQIRILCESYCQNPDIKILANMIFEL